MRIKYHDEWLELACYILYPLPSTFLPLFPFPLILLGTLKEGKCYLGGQTYPAFTSKWIAMSLGHCQRVLGFPNVFVSG